jgi:hypothetical protein
MEHPVYKGQDTAELFETADFVAEGSFHSQQNLTCPSSPTVVQG